MLKISVIIPIYNVEQYLNHCIDSILSQNYNNFEIILIDDESTDNSLKICKEYQSKEERVIVISQKNQGQGVARNTGLLQATGDYIWFIDSDDWIEKEAMSLLVNELNQNKVEMLGFSATDFFQDTNQFGKPIRLNTIPTTNGMNYIDQNGIMTATVWNFLYSRQFLTQNQLYFKPNIIHEDDYFQIQCFALAKSVKKIPLSLYYYRIRVGSTMTSKLSLKRILSYFELIKLCANMKSSTLDNKFVELRIWYYISTLFDLLAIFDLKSNEKFKLLKDIKKTVPKCYAKLIGSKMSIFEKNLYNFNVFIFYYYIKYLKKVHLILIKK